MSRFAHEECDEWDEKPKKNSHRVKEDEKEAKTCQAVSQTFLFPPSSRFWFHKRLFVCDGKHRTKSWNEVEDWKWMGILIRKISDVFVLVIVFVPGRICQQRAIMQTFQCRSINIESIRISHDDSLKWATQWEIKMSRSQRSQIRRNVEIWNKFSISNFVLKMLT